MKIGIVIEYVPAHNTKVVCIKRKYINEYSKSSRSTIVKWADPSLACVY